MQSVWTEQYQKQVPCEIAGQKFASLNAMLDYATAEYAEKTAFSCLGSQMSFKELTKHAEDFAAYLQQDLRLEPKDRVAIMLPNVLQYPIALFGILQAGMIVVNVNPLYTAHELVKQLNDAEVKCLLVLDNFAHTIVAALPQIPSLQHIIVTTLGDMLPTPNKLMLNFLVRYIKRAVPKWQLSNYTWWLDCLAKGAKQKFTKVDITTTDVAFLQYTGGTTGVAKGAILTHGNMLANLEQARSWISPVVIPGKERILTSLPLYHIFSLMANCLLFVYLGGENTLVVNPKNIKRLVKIWDGCNPTVVTGVNTLFNALVNYHGFARLNFNALKIVIGGGMAVQETTAWKWQNITGLPIIEAYGLTEASPAVCINPLNIQKYNGTIGLPIPSTDVAIKSESGEELGFEDVGELWVRGPQIMQGYWNNPEDTKEVIIDGWLKTGDLAFIDPAGFVHIVDRKKDMIIVSGFNVYPNQIEDIIAKMPEVAEVGVVGVPDNVSGERPKAFVVLKQGAQIDAKQVRDYCREYLTSYKVPKHVEFCRELPKTNVGKVLRQELRAR